MNYIKVVAASPDGGIIVVSKDGKQGYLKKGQPLDTVKWVDGGSILASAIFKGDYMPIDPPKPYKGGNNNAPVSK